MQLVGSGLTPDHMVHVVEFEARPMYDTYLKP
jgi:hypothetical protein